MHDIRAVRPWVEDADEAGGENRRRFEAAGVHVVRVLGAPGSGKTALLARVIEKVRDHRKVAVLAAEEEPCLLSLGVPVRRVHAHGECRLDPRAVGAAAQAVGLSGLNLLFIEDVACLAGPAEVDLGERDRLLVLSVAAGHGLVARYSATVRTVDLLVLNGIDLLPHVEFDLAEATRTASGIAPGITVVAASARTGEGIDRVVAWLGRR